MAATLGLCACAVSCVPATFCDIVDGDLAGQYVLARWCARELRLFLLTSPLTKRETTTIGYGTCKSCRTDARFDPRGGVY